MRSLLLLGVGAVGFCIVAVANAAGYRYGTSDQEFYIPAVYLELDPALFPHDRSFLEANDLLLGFDDLTAALVRNTGVEIETVFLVGYFAALVLLYGAALVIGRTIYRSAWSVGALAAALTLRHQIPGSAVNTFEGYLHPRMLAFGIGAAALASFLRGRLAAAAGLVAAAATIHPTTGLWFVVWIGTAFLVAGRMRPAWLAAGASLVLLAAAIGLHQISGGLVFMDEAWVAALGDRSYFFFDRWPVWAWFVHVSAVGLIWWSYRRRVAAGQAHPRERPIVIGLFTLVAIFVLVIPFVEARLALAVLLQMGRVFWMVDLWATVYLISILAEFRPMPRSGTRWQPRLTCFVLLSLACARGTYLMLAAFPDRPLVRRSLPDSDWMQVMAWAAETPGGANVLADPGHARRYGASVRIGARRDVYLEESKDPALAAYSASSARRVADRIRDLGNFNELDAARARALAATYDLDYVVTEGSLDLPLAYQYGRFRVYRLKDARMK